MQEIKKLVRYLFAFLMRLIRHLFRTVPLLKHAAIALFRRFPRVGVFYSHLMPPLQNQHVADAVSTSIEKIEPIVQIAPPRKRPLTPHAAMIFNDLKTAVCHNETHGDATKLASVPSSKGQS